MSNCWLDSIQEEDEGPVSGRLSREINPDISKISSVLEDFQMLCINHQFSADYFFLYAHCFIERYIKTNDAPYEFVSSERKNGVMSFKVVNKENEDDWVIFHFYEYDWEHPNASFMEKFLHYMKN